jgi:hypothetical protein
MSAWERLESTVRQAARRRRWQRAWVGFWRGLVAGGVVWLLALAAWKCYPLPLAVLPLGGALGVIVSVAGFALGAWRRESTPQAARWLDRTQALQERLATALELGHEAKRGQWAKLLVGDAARHLGDLEIRRLLPYRLPQASRWALLVLALVAGLGFVPEHRSAAYLQKQREKEQVRQTGQQLANVARHNLERRAPALESTRQSVESVATLGEHLARKPVTRNEALRELAKLTDQVQQNRRDLAQNPALRAMDRAARAAGRDTPPNPTEMQKQMESLAKSLGNQETNADALDKLQRELEQARRAAEDLAKQGSAAAEALKESLARALSDLAKGAQQLGAVLPSLAQAAAALRSGQIDQVLKDLQSAEKDLEQLKETAEALQRLQEQAEKIGKDLAEQLQNGQAEAARETLQKMVNQLKAGNLSRAQRDALLAELGKAIPASAPYGKVPELLKQARRQMESGDNPGAAQSLADAAGELGKLMQQLADAQDLKSALDALRRAQTAIGGLKSWAAAGAGMPGSKPGGKPGRGVGTWAEDESQPGPAESSGLWDNSGIERPDRASRGETDRGAGEVPEGMVPTKVKGRLQPGGQMPSITLKGVSIKGSSTVAVQEAIRAAQSEAQAALSHDQVPRAYQGAVKDYFGDLQ